MSAREVPYLVQDKAARVRVREPVVLVVGVQAQKTRFKLNALYALSGSRVESMSLSS